MQELDIYTEQLNDINNFFRDDNGNVTRLLNPTDVGRYLNKDPRFCIKAFNMGKFGITNIELAKKLAHKS